MIRVILVEDDLISRFCIRNVLENICDIQVVAEADNGLEAVRMVDEVSPDVVLMDLEMPVMDGIQASRQIREKDKGVRILILTSHCDENHVRASLSVGATGYCLKGIEADRLPSAICAVHAGDVWLDHAVSHILQG